MKDPEPELFIAGEFRPAGNVKPVIEPATDRVLGSGPNATSGDIDDAVAAAQKALHDWKSTPATVPKNRSRGWYVAPTIFADVNNAARIAREEIFGPVLCIIPYDSDGDAVDIANDSDFGLAGTVWSSDDARATEIARALQTGTVGINQYQLDVAAPFGGVKNSGLGRELGPEGLAAYQITKSIFRNAAASAG